MTKRLTISLPEAVYEKLRTEAFYKRTTFSAIIRAKLYSYVNKKLKIGTGTSKKYKK